MLVIQSENKKVILGIQSSFLDTVCLIACPNTHFFFFRKVELASFYRGEYCETL